MDIYKELLKTLNYRRIIAKLKDRASKEKNYISDQRLDKVENIDWLVNSERSIVKELITAIKRREYLPGLAKRSVIFVYRSRQIFTLNLTDKLVENLLADLVHQSFGPFYSKGLHSFQRGKSNLTALGALGQYVKSNKNLWIFRTDIQKYGDKIDAQIVTSVIKQTIAPQDSYVWKLLDSFLQPRYFHDQQICRLDFGMPTGFSISPVCENIYLTHIDNYFTANPDLIYLRYGDDIIIASDNRDLTLKSGDKIAQMLGDLNLECHPKKTTWQILSADKIKDSKFKSVREIDYLGHSLDSNGRFFLSSNKQKELKEFLAIRIKIAASSVRRVQKDKQAQVQALVIFVKRLLNGTSQHPFINLLITTSNDERQLKDFDTWIATEILGNIYGRTGSGVFRHFSFRKLRDFGLPSLMHLTRIAQRQECDS